MNSWKLSIIQTTKRSQNYWNMFSRCWLKDINWSATLMSSYTSWIQQTISLFFSIRQICVRKWKTWKLNWIKIFRKNSPPKSTTPAFLTKKLCGMHWALFKLRPKVLKIMQISHVICLNSLFKIFRKIVLNNLINKVPVPMMFWSNKF